LLGVETILSTPVAAHSGHLGSAIVSSFRMLFGAGIIPQGSDIIIIEQVNSPIYPERL